MGSELGLNGQTFSFPPEEIKHVGIICQCDLFMLWLMCALVFKYCCCDRLWFEVYMCVVLFVLTMLGVDVELQICLLLFAVVS